MKVPGAGERLGRQLVGFVQELRKVDLFKVPGIAETIEWADALLQLNAMALDRQIVDDTLGILLKYQDDIDKVRGSEAADILDRVKADLAKAS